MDHLVHLLPAFVVGRRGSSLRTAPRGYPNAFVAFWGTGSPRPIISGNAAHAVLWAHVDGIDDLRAAIASAIICMDLTHVSRRSR